MASKKGIALTIGVLGAITIASFLIWILPQSTEMTFVVTNFEVHLDGIKNIHGAIQDTVDSEFQNLLDEKISPQAYIEQAEGSSSQINSQIIQLINSQPSEEWQESYKNYLESLRNYNSYIRETIVVANMIEDGADDTEMESIILRINEFKENSDYFISESDKYRP